MGSWIESCAQCLKQCASVNVQLPLFAKIPSKATGVASGLETSDKDYACRGRSGEIYSVHALENLPQELRTSFGFSGSVAGQNYSRRGKKRIALLLLWLGALIPMNLSAGSAGFFEPTGNLITPSYGGSAILLPTGKVLAAGELYDPATGTWAMTESGGGSEPMLLPDGKVLSEGGLYFNGHVTEGQAYAQLYNPAAGSSSATANMIAARYAHAATLLPNGLALVLGGLDVFVLSGVEVFDPASATWNSAGHLITARSHHSATLLPNGKVLIAGGDTGYGNGVMTSSELYDPATGTSMPTGSLNVPRYLHRAILLSDGRVLAVGGLDDPGHIHPLASAGTLRPSQRDLDANRQPQQCTSWEYGDIIA